MPTRLTTSSPTGESPKNRFSKLLDPDDFEPPEKCYVTDDDVDEGLIIHANDGTDLLVGDNNDLLAKAKAIEQCWPHSLSYSAANDLLGSLAKALETLGDLGINVNDKLARIICKQWRKTPTPAKSQIISHKYKRPANCTAYPIKIKKVHGNISNIIRNRRSLGWLTFRKI